MSDLKHLLTSLKKHLWRYFLILIILGLAVYLLVPQITTLEHSWSVVQSMTWWAVALAVIAQVLSYLGGGFMMQAILEIDQQKLSIWEGALMTMASYSVGMVAGGWFGGAAATYSWVRQESHDGESAALAGTLPALLNIGALVVVSIIGTLYLILVHDLSKMQLIEYGIVLLVLGVMTASVVAALRFSETATRLAVWLAGRWAALRRKPFTPQKTIGFVGQFVFAWNSLRDGKWLRPMLGAIANTGFDMLTLYFLFVAARHNISLGILFAGYGLPLILGKAAFLFPGGVGVIEGSMVAFYDSLQVPNAVSVVAILGYRLFSFWLPTLLGFAAAAYLSRKLSRTRGKKV
jgi:uncharacterized protein (TIRG00374 family)